MAGADSPKGPLRSCRMAQQPMFTGMPVVTPWGVILVQREIATLSYCRQLGWDIPPSCSSAGCAIAEGFAVLTSSVGLNVSPVPADLSSRCALSGPPASPLPVTLAFACCLSVPS